MNPNSITAISLAKAATSFICAEYRVSITSLCGPSKEQRYVWPRWLLIHLLDTYCHYNASALAYMLRRNRNSIAKARRSFETEYRTNPRRAAELHSIDTKFATLISPMLGL